MPVNLFEVAMSEARQRQTEVDLSDCTVVMLGSRGVGKTTLISGWVDRKDPVKPTLALEYTFRNAADYSLNPFKKSGAVTAHIWELRGGTALFLNLLEVPLTLKNLGSGIVVLIMIDLSRPERLWATIETQEKELRKMILGVLSKDGALKEKVLKAAAQRVEGHADLAYLDPFPVPLVILGGKYDLFEKLEPENKKVVCRTLRSLAHLWGATLQFTSHEGLLFRKAKDTLSEVAFGVPPASAPSVVQDYNKPLYIPVGSDSFGNIAGGGTAPVSAAGEEREGGTAPVSAAGEEGEGGTAPVSAAGEEGEGGQQQPSGTVGGVNLDLLRETLHSYFPQEPPESYEIPPDPAADKKFAEPDIDSLRKEKELELEGYLKEIQARRAGSTGDFLG